MVNQSERQGSRRQLQLNTACTCTRMTYGGLNAQTKCRGSNEARPPMGALDSPMEDQISGGIIMSKTALGGLLLCTYGGPKIQKPPKGGTNTPLHVWGI